MSSKKRPVGKCIFCGKEFAKAGIMRHLSTHLQQKQLEEKPGKSFLIKVEPNPRWESSPYFLALWVDGDALMEEIDGFLRSIWLECCGHLSDFKKKTPMRQRASMWDYFKAEKLLEQGKLREYERLMEEENGEVPKSRKAKAVFAADVKLDYTYDYGSSTELLLTSIAEYPIQASQNIVLLSRNEPAAMLCDECGKQPAAYVCTVCSGYEEQGAFCKTCAKKHRKSCSDFDEYAVAEVVNSPRMGVCAYDGGSIDKLRDRPQAIKK